MILVTGVAGKTGRAVLRALRKTGAQTRALVRNIPEPELAAVEAFVGDLLDGASLAKAIDGVTAIYLICPNVHPNEFQMAKAVIEAAQGEGVKRLVYHSVLFPQIEAMPHHWQKLHVEEALIQSGLDFTILQPASYMQNVLAYWEDIQRDGFWNIPYSINQKFSPVDLEDVASVATKVLLELGHSNAIYELAGPEVLSSEEIADAISDYLGSKVAARAQNLGDWNLAATANDMDPYTQKSLAMMFDYYDQHGFVGNSSTLERLLGRPPTTFSQFLRRVEK